MMFDTLCRWCAGSCGFFFAGHVPEYCPGDGLDCPLAPQLPPQQFCGIATCTECRIYNYFTTTSLSWKTPGSLALQGKVTSCSVAGWWSDTAGTRHRGSAQFPLFLPYIVLRSKAVANLATAELTSMTWAIKSFSLPG